MRNKPSIRLFFIATALFYILNCFAPLRLEYDSIHYFSLKECLENACPAGFHAADDPHPFGYPLLLWGLARLGILHAFVIAGVNALFLAGSLFFVTGTLPAALRSFALFPLVLLQWTFIKFFAYPLSEMQYLFFSTGCLYCFQRYTQERRPGWLIGAIAGAGLAFFTRGAGLVLAPAILAGLICQYREVLKVKVRRKILWVPGAVLCLIVLLLLCAKPLRLGLYLDSIQRRGPGTVFLLTGHIKEWGQLLLNVPGSKITGFLPGWGNGLLILAGLLLAGLFSYALFIRRKHMPVVVSVYLLAYCVLLFNWPFYDARFWMPVLPFVGVLIISLKDQFRGVLKTTLQSVFILYLCMGLGAAGYSTYTAFHKEALARTQAGGIFRNEYETYFFGKPLSDSVSRTDPYILNILKRYN